MTLVKCDDININRVYVPMNNGFEGIPPKRALELGFSIDIIYQRKDGWILGTPVSCSREAYALYKDEWEFYYLDHKDGIHLERYSMDEE